MQSGALSVFLCAAGFQVGLDPLHAGDEWLFELRVFGDGGFEQSGRAPSTAWEVAVGIVASQQLIIDRKLLFQGFIPGRWSGRVLGGQHWPRADEDQAQSS